MTAAQQAQLVVIMARRPWTCASCATEFHLGALLKMDDAGPMCMDCADLAHLEFLPRGNTALTRRARKASRLAAVVVEWSRTRKRYERQGILAEANAIAHAEQECLADVELRERRRERDAQRRSAEDQRFIADLAAAVRRQFPGCPAKRALRIAEHAGARSSGRIGRTSAGRGLDPEAVRLAVVASVRHQDTRYDELLMQGVARDVARERVGSAIDRILRSWSAG